VLSADLNHTLNKSLIILHTFLSILPLEFDTGKSSKMAQDRLYSDEYTHCQCQCIACIFCIALKHHAASNVQSPSSSINEQKQLDLPLLVCKEYHGQVHYMTTWWLRTPFAF
jgi:hypothetical protein